MLLVRPCPFNLMQKTCRQNLCSLWEDLWEISIEVKCEDVLPQCSHISGPAVGVV